ncbi:hypothetical protein [Sphingomonas sp. NFR15]|uniref:hypothetical protein n=1 Tax=Sphingomonas sp. NFR15 TaxID=1566282 RepID=UPI0008803C4A|nr:hypothetical protein [Sphingomonas sp. NFR15]SDA14785.1 hypothetical protein SAMN03159340_00594 [Sphingomonas sp. NFR15]
MATAREHTRTIITATDSAWDAIRYFNGRVYNGHGELSDPSYARSQLRDAKRNIEIAIAAIDAAGDVGWTKHDD